MVQAAIGLRIGVLHAAAFIWDRHYLRQLHYARGQWTVARTMAAATYHCMWYRLCNRITTDTIARTSYISKEKSRLSSRYFCMNGGKTSGPTDTIARTSSIPEEKSRL